MSKIQTLNEYGQVKQQTNRDVRQLGVLTGAKYEADSTASQTVINLNFSVAQTTEAKRGFQLFIDGQLLREGASNDFQFTAIQGGVSAQVTLNSAIIAGLNIVAYQIGAYQSAFPNPSTVTATLLNDVAQPNLMAQAAFQPFVKKTFITAPNTQITNRAQVEDMSLKPVSGVERIMTRSISQLNTEFGSIGQPVYEISSKDSRIRLVGAGWTSGGWGPGVFYTPTANDFMEITFYGTGLNLITHINNDARDARVTVDGGTESATNILIGATGSQVLSGRGYAPNNVVSAASGLTFGLHTIKIRCQSTYLLFSGVEILNERATFGVLTGTAYGGTKEEILNSISSTSLTAGVVGTRGARVVKYIKDGVVSQAVQEVNAVSAVLASTDHTNEELLRRINYREFGVNRSDDFSTLSTSASARAFVLDDGVTALIGTQVRGSALLNGLDSFYPVISNDTWTFTFVGTGLDLYGYDNGAAAGTNTYSIDNGAPSLLAGSGSTLPRVIRICSGLPYGTHTFKYTSTAGSANALNVADFMIYGPKKPAIPAGAIEVADYNVVANYVASASAALGSVGTGVIRKNPLREIVPVGTWSAPSITPTAFECGWNFNMTNIVGNYAEFTFYGTGIVFSGHAAATQPQNTVVSIDGSVNLSGFTTSVVQVGTGVTFNATTGNITGTSASDNPYRLSITGLALGKHTIKILQNSTAGQVYFNGFDIVTPIHINATSFKVGSLSLRDSRAFSPVIDKPDKIDLGSAKATLVYDLTNSKIIYSTNIIAVLKTGTGVINIYFEKPFKTRNYIMLGSNVGGQVYGLEAGRFTNMCTIIFANNTGGGLDSLTNCASFFGELEDEGEI